MISLPDIYPKTWENKVNLPTLDCLEFRNLLHFKSYVTKLTQINDDYCGVTYKEALKDLLNNKSCFEEKEYATIRNLVRSNLLKRGLLTEEVYENFKYSTDGTTIDYDMGKYANGEPDCVITPSVQYVDFFYELYVNISYPSYISNNDIKENINKMLATIEELQRQHIYIKITLVFAGHHCNEENDFFSVIPLFSHREFKEASVMSSVLNDRLLRKFYFAILEDYYKENLSYDYGLAIKLPDAMNVWETFNEVEFFTKIKNHVEGIM